MFEYLYNLIRTTFMGFTVFDAIDILLVWGLVYYMLKFIVGTRSFYILLGIIILLILNAFAYFLGLYALSWLMRYVNIAILVALPIVFQPELRAILAQLGQGALVNPFSELMTEDVIKFTDDIVKAVQNLRDKGIGALIVIERAQKLNEYVRRGVQLSADVHPLLFESIFEPTSPLHDGAAIIRGLKVIAVGCYLPIDTEADLPPEYGARHRAGLGITKISDALAIIISEERQQISVAFSGNMIVDLELDELSTILRNSLYHTRGGLKNLIDKTLSDKLVLKT